VLLRAYPRDFRDEYGDDMASMFRLRLGESRLSAWSGAISDLLFGATREHMAILSRDLVYAFRTWRQTPVLPLVAITALAFGVGANRRKIVSLEGRRIDDRA
jgi:hypothetical protein